MPSAAAVPVVPAPSVPATPVARRIPPAMAGARGAVLVFGVILLAAIWGFTLDLLASERATAFRTAANDSANLARAFAEHSVRTIQAADQTVLFVKSRYEELGERFDLVRHMQSNVILNNFFTGVYVVGEDGRVLLSSVQPFQRTDLSDREHIRVHVPHDSGALFVGKPVLGRVSKKWSIQLTRRINKPDGSFGGVAVVSADPLYFSEFYSGVSLPQASIVMLAGDDGVVRARQSGEDREVGQDIAQGGVFAAARAEKAGVVVSTSPIDGVSRQIAFRHLAEYPMFVAVGVPVAAIDAQVAPRRAAALAMASAGSLLVLLFSAWIAVLIRRTEAARQQAERASRMKSEFLANMSHELRTPLNGILGFSELLRDSVRDDDERAFVDAISSSGRHLLALLNEILDLAKIEAGRLDIVRQAEDPAELVHAIVDAHRSTASRKGLALGVQLRAMPAGVLCDRVRLTQVLNNLLSNAVKFTERGRVDVSAAWERGVLRVAVEDTGPGIEPEVLARLFRAFEQGDGSLTRRHEGTGLGLALARRLVELMDGSVDVVSSPGAGSRFAFHVAAPLAAHAPAADEVMA